MKNSHKVWFGLLLLVLVGIAGAFSISKKDTRTAVQSDSGWKTYADSDYGFSFQYPSDWKLNIQGKNSIFLIDPQKNALSIKMKKEGDEAEIGRTGVGGDNLVRKGTVSFLGLSLSEDIIALKERDIGIIYNGGNVVQVPKSELSFDLSFDAANAYADSLSISTEETADKIIESFKISANDSASVSATPTSNQANGFSFVSPAKGDIWKIGQTREIQFSKPLPYEGHCVNQLYLIDANGNTVGALGLVDYGTALNTGGMTALWNGEDLWPSICGTSMVQFMAKPGTYRLMMHEEDTRYGVGKTIEFYSGYFTLQAPIEAKNTVQFRGGVSRGQAFQKDIGGGMLFKLVPEGTGWNISIVSKTAQSIDYDFTLATPPFHGMTALQIQGSQFTSNADALSSQKVRNFSFVLNAHDAQVMGDAITRFTSGTSSDFNPQISSFGQGEFVISGIKLGNAETGSQAAIDSMDFNVSLYYPLPTSEYLKEYLK